MCEIIRNTMIPVDILKDVNILNCHTSWAYLNITFFSVTIDTLKADIRAHIVLRFNVSLMQHQKQTVLHVYM